MENYVQNPTLGDVIDPERNSFGVLRLALAIAVVISHAHFFLAGITDRDPVEAFTGHALSEHAVQVFFILSGVLVTESLLRSKSTLDFIAARLLRIFPGLIVCVLLTALVLGPEFTVLSRQAYMNSPELPDYIVRTILLTTGAAPLPGLFTNLPAQRLVNVSLWTLKYEMMCYAALAVAGMLGVFRPRLRLIATAVLAGGLAVLLLKSPFGPENAQLENLRHFALYFDTGVLAALLKDHLPLRLAGVVVLGAVYAVSVSTPFAEFTCALALGYTALYVGSANFGVLRRFCQSTDLSFGLYIYSAPVQQALISINPNLSVGLLTVQTLMFTLPLAVLSWHLVEKPALALRRLRFTQPPAPDEPGNAVPAHVIAARMA